MPSKEELEKRLDSQKDLLRFWDELSEKERETLSAQVEEIDVQKCKEAFLESEHIHVPDLEKVRPVPDDRYIVSSKLPKEELHRYFRLGLEAISRNELCVLVLSGGQASRLGSLIPKGTLPLGLPSEDGRPVVNGDSLLAIQASKIHRLQELSRKAFPGTSGKIQWGVMTSSGTHKDTIEHLEKIVPLNGLSMDDVTIFSQANIPAFDFQGNLLLSKKGEICTAPNGNGGIYSELAHHLPKLRARGVKYVQTYCVDNILCRVGDPAMLGMVIEKKADCAAKTLEKILGELMGSITVEDGKARVTEYSELGNLESRVGPDGKLLYRAGSIAIHFFTMNFLESFCTPDFHLPYHRALKKIAYVDEHGELQKPSEPNGIKLEQFIFDVFPMSHNFYAWEAVRNDEFSPLKNAESVGSNCLSTCIRDLAAQSRSWLEKAGAKCVDGKQVFISPSRSYCGEGLEEFAGKEITQTIIH
ncbi:unnamed protein product, partial [Mesorhabditis belari]|uniref:UDP-N-acetylglucosamine diphosphorylase n=1 Tax=Mesorhabditis belari TaxID=2138241 RepID=A0AAF3FQY3_9BILA